MDGEALLSTLRKTTRCKVNRYHYFKRAALQRRLARSKQIEFLFGDYRKIDGKFDRVVSIEMIEAVGDKFFLLTLSHSTNFLNQMVSTIQAITSPDSRYEEFKSGTDFIQKHIFPGSLLPSIRAMVNAVRKQIFTFTDCLIWDFTTRKHYDVEREFLPLWEDIKPMGFNDIFKRKWSITLPTVRRRLRPETLVPSN